MKKIIAIACFLAATNAHAQVGINTTTPQRSLDIEGTLRLSQTLPDNTPAFMLNSTSARPLYGNSTNGQVTYAPNGYTTVVGGFRPGVNNVIKVFPTTNTLARIKFVHYVKNSGVNNAKSDAYTYGDFVIIGMAGSIKFLTADIRGYDGNVKGGFTMTDTQIAFNNYNGQKNFLTLDQTTGELKLLQNDNTYAFYFEILGGY